ncbi:hypothetical protein [Streptomyces sp. 7N604]|uniref:hypothetical protein n=1 Tax=Streptomyces sp. 7N604 TaxID=3457415 RepID=UPI003FD054C9
MALRRATAADVLAMLSTLLLAVLMFCQATATPAEAGDIRAGGAPKEADSLAGGPSWDDPHPADGPHPHPSATRPYNRPIALPPPTGGRTLSVFTSDGGPAARSIPRPTAHGPPHGPPGLGPAARPAVLQVFRL